MASKQKSSKKANRNRDWCKSYKARDQRGRNKARTLKRVLKDQPTNLVAIKALDKYDAVASEKALKVRQQILKERAENATA